MCVVGPNEAGKSSMLDALAHLDNDTAFRPTDRTRGEPGSTIPQVRPRFVLEREDKDTIAEVPEAKGVRQLVIWKQGGERGYRLEPAPERETYGRGGTFTGDSPGSAMGAGRPPVKRTTLRRLIGWRISSHRRSSYSNPRNRRCLQQAWTGPMRFERNSGHVPTTLLPIAIVGARAFGSIAPRNNLRRTSAAHGNRANSR